MKSFQSVRLETENFNFNIFDLMSQPQALL